MVERYEFCTQHGDSNCDGKVNKIPSNVTVVSGTSDANAGKRIKQFIKTAREEIEREKEISRNEEIEK